MLKRNVSKYQKKKFYFILFPETNTPDVVARTEEGTDVHKVLVRKPQGKRQLGRPRRRWEDNIKMDIQKEGWRCGNWMGLTQDRDRWRAPVSTVMNFRVVP